MSPTIGSPLITAHTADADRRAFTLIELLVVIGIITILLGIMLPSMNRARVQAQRTQCMSNLRTAGQAFYVYAAEHNGRLPVHPGMSNWLWDLPSDTRDAMVAAGMHRQTFYCPSGDLQNDDGLWQFAPGYSVTGYFWLTKRVRVLGTQLVPTGPNLISHPPDGMSQYVDRLNMKNSSAIELGADATLSTQGNFAMVRGGWSAGAHRSSHLRTKDAKLAEGGNVLFMDGHVEWRPFEWMWLRAQPDDGAHDEWY